MNVRVGHITRWQAAMGGFTPRASPPPPPVAFDSEDEDDDGNANSINEMST